MLRHPGTWRRRPEGLRVETYARMKATYYARLIEMYSKEYPAPESTLIDLTNLITRHEENLLSSSEHQQLLLTSEFHRGRVAANLEHGRNLLFEVERSLQHIKDQSRKESIQNGLESKKKQIKSLRNYLHDLTVRAEAHDGTADDEGVSSDNEEDTLHTPQESTSGPSSPLSTVTKSPPLREAPENAGTITNSENAESTQSGEGDNVTPPTVDHKLASATAATPTEKPQRSTPTLRKRMRSTTGPTSTNESTTAAATGTATSPAAPFQPTTTGANATDARQPLASETSLAEQENLTSSLVSLATELKSSSQSFQHTLESERPVLSGAVEGLDRNISGMDTAGQRMGFLRRMTEGKGWWGRMLLYAWIFGLWIVVLLIVHVGPKFRF